MYMVWRGRMKDTGGAGIVLGDVLWFICLELGLPQRWYARL